MDLLEANYRTWCAQNNIAIDDGPLEGNQLVDVEMNGAETDLQTDQTPDEDEWEGFMDVDDAPEIIKANAKLVRAGSKRRRRDKVAELVREKVRSVLEDKLNFADRRARQCDEGDFLRLLLSMNEEGIHFS